MEDLRPCLFKVNKEKFTFRDKYPLCELAKRPDKEQFIDTIFFGVIISKNTDINKYKIKIKEELYKVWDA